LTLLNGYSPHLNAQHIEIDVGIIVASDVKNQFNESTDGTSCLDIKEYAYKGSSRAYAEALLICQALTLGGIEPIFKFHQYPNYGRALKELTKGSTHIMFSTVWLSKQHENFYVSDSLMGAGEFEKGFYTLEDNKALLNVRDLKQLQRFSAISNKQFIVDWQVLSQLGIAIYSNPHWELLYKMLKAKRGDFILAEFSPEPDMSIITAGVKLIPVPNIKITFNDSRHVFVNKHKDNSTVIFSALQSGLKILHQRGLIKKAYQSLGFYNEKTKSWLSLYRQEKKVGADMLLLNNRKK
jgi:hypothetical protein